MPQLNNHITADFRFDEVICPCCKRVKLIPIFWTHMEKLQRLRDAVGPISINSGYRCLDHNDTVGGSFGSMHMAFATDIMPADGDSAKLKEMEEIATSLGFNGRGIHPTFIHIDLRTTPWTRRYKT